MNYSKSNIIDLKSKCNEKGLNSNGSISELRKRLLEHDKLNELRSLCKEKGLSRSGTISELEERLHQNELYDNSHKITDVETLENDTSFSFSGLLCSIVFGYMLFKIVLPFAKSVDYFYYKVYDGSYINSLVIKFIDYISNNDFSNFASFFQSWVWLLFVSYFLKTLVAVNHIFNPSLTNIFYISLIAMVLEILPLFFKMLAYNSIDFAVISLVILYTPTIICNVILFIPLILKDSTILDK